ncbi:MAG: sterol desaturase family protein [Rhodobacteraceae bacterium]|nr:sterol desaturase family protein [Paracoccaceae bacterium]|tara:strand:- start:119 stop:1126 length:1008 start_codon:yes stop_codon:yes gene_type:complete
MEKGKEPGSQTSNPTWNYAPDLPIKTAPYFNWPPNPKHIISWLIERWFPITERGLLVCLAIFIWVFATPALERCKTLEIGWMAEIYFRNFLIMCLVAGGAHLYLYTFSKQQKLLKFDAKDLKKNNSLFSFKNQVWDNMFWSLASGVTVWSFYEIIIMWGFANGYGFMFDFSDNRVWFVALFFLLPFWQAFAFYWIHRALHWPPLYRIAHVIHHRNTNIGPWSGNSMHPVEHILWLSSVLIHLVIASHPIHVLFFQLSQVISAITNHSGFESIMVRDKSRLAMGDFFHQLHHRYYECNYGSIETHWDKLFGTFHDGTDKGLEITRRRKREIHKRTI